MLIPASEELSLDYHRAYSFLTLNRPRPVLYVPGLICCLLLFATAELIRPRINGGASGVDKGPITGQSTLDEVIKQPPTCSSYSKHPRANCSNTLAFLTDRKNSTKSTNGRMNDSKISRHSMGLAISPASCFGIQRMTAFDLMRWSKKLEL